MELAWATHKWCSKPLTCWIQCRTLSALPSQIWLQTHTPMAPSPIPRIPGFPRKQCKQASTSHILHSGGISHSQVVEIDLLHLTNTVWLQFNVKSNQWSTNILSLPQANSHFSIDKAWESSCRSIKQAQWQKWHKPKVLMEFSFLNRKIETTVGRHYTDQGAYSWDIVQHQNFFSAPLRNGWLFHWKWITFSRWLFA